MPQCQFCKSHKTKLLIDTLYCENCEIYFTLKNGIQLIKTLPLAETKQRSLNFCADCTKTALKNNTVKCKTFREYIKKLPYCKSCKALNLIFLKNLFFKNFLLYKKIENQFGISLLLSIIFTWSYFENYLALFYYYIEILSGNLSTSSFILISFLFYHLNRYSVFRFILFIICIFKVLFTKTIYFDVPINLLSTKELDNFLNRLNINSSFDNGVYKNRKKASINFMSHSDLKSLE